jgi:hypothetical protein
MPWLPIFIAILVVLIILLIFIKVNSKSISNSNVNSTTPYPHPQSSVDNTDRNGNADANTMKNIISANNLSELQSDYFNMTSYYYYPEKSVIIGFINQKPVAISIDESEHIAKLNGIRTFRNARSINMGIDLKINVVLY